MPPMSTEARIEPVGSAERRAGLRAGGYAHAGLAPADEPPIVAVTVKLLPPGTLAKV